MAYEKMTAKQRKMKARNDPMVVVGFGKNDLKDLLKLRGTDREEELINAPVTSPGRWRRASICTKEEIEAFKDFAIWIGCEVNLLEEE